jgi:hypothetical protein
MDVHGKHMVELAEVLATIGDLFGPYVANAPNSKSASHHPLVMRVPDGFESLAMGGKPAIDPSIDKTVQIVPGSPEMNSTRHDTLD